MGRLVGLKRKGSKIPKRSEYPIEQLFGELHVIYVANGDLESQRGRDESILLHNTLIACLSIKQSIDLKRIPVHAPHMRTLGVPPESSAITVFPTRYNVQGVLGPKTISVIFLPRQRSGRSSISCIDAQEDAWLCSSWDWDVKSQCTCSA